MAAEPQVHVGRVYANICAKLSGVDIGFADDKLMLTYDNKIRIVDVDVEAGFDVGRRINASFHVVPCATLTRCVYCAVRDDGFAPADVVYFGDLGRLISADAAIEHMRSVISAFLALQNIELNIIGRPAQVRVHCRTKRGWTTQDHPLRYAVGVPGNPAIVAAAIDRALQEWAHGL